MCPRCSRDNYDVAQSCSQCHETLRGLLGQNTVLENRYQANRVLGCGGMGAVYLASDLRIQGRQVAIKENLDTSGLAQSQFDAEVKVMAALRHPNLPAISDHFIGPNGRQYLVMDYIPGDTLEDIVAQRGPVSEAEAAALVSQLLDVLGYLHAAGIVHRDIKPANIKRTPDGKLFLVDFGIAKRQATGFVTQMWARGVGSPGFAPIEQYGGGTDGRTDIYSLGAVFYFLLTAQVPPEAPDLASGTLLRPPSQMRGGITSDTDRLVLRAMAAQPIHRFQSVAEMRQALQIRGAPGSFTPPIRPGNRRFVMLGTAIALALVAVMAVLALVRNLNDTPAAPPVLPPSVASDTPVPRLTPTGVASEETADGAVVLVPSNTPTRQVPTDTPTRRPPTKTPVPPTATPIPPTATPVPIPVAVARADGVTVRSGPGIEYSDIVNVGQGTQMVIAGRNDTCRWLKVTLAGGQQGWVAQEYVDANVPTCDPPLVAAPPTPTVAPTPTRPPSALASNVSQFSGSQGANGWRYQIEQGRNSGNFVDFPNFGAYQSGDGKPARNCWLTPQEGHVRICQNGEVHPGATGRIALRWQSDIARTARIQVHAHKVDTTCGNNDGVWIGVFRVPSGQPPEKIGEFSIAGANSQDRPANTYNWTVNLNNGDLIMVMVDVARSPACDMTRLYVDIN